jgi:hypothetical protein
LRFLLRSLDRDRLILSYYSKETDCCLLIVPFLELLEGRTEDEDDYKLKGRLLGWRDYEWLECYSGISILLEIN